ncbi:MAG: hypothetical protein Q8R63_02455 [Ramlibacter sp.]|nr:hypothetical protein [Ramlibacter sp.]
MPTPQTTARIEQLIWVLIYAGLFAVVIGLASLSASPETAWSLITVGGVLVAAGVFLIWVRSRFDERTMPGKTSSNNPSGKQDK